MKRSVSVSRIVNRICAVVLLVVLAVSTAVLAAAIMQTERTAAPRTVEAPVADRYRYLRVTVAPGDTIWGLARKYYPNVDPRLAVAAIQALNELADAIIYPGQVLAIPVLHTRLSVRLASTGDLQHELITNH